MRGRLMPPIKPPPPPESPFHVKMAKDIGRYGFMVVAVMPTEDHPGMSFAYTVGLFRTHDHPELVIVGWNGVDAHAVLSDLIDGIKGGERYRPDTLYEDLFPSASSGREGYDGWFKTVEGENRDEYMALAHRWNGWGSFPALQVVWPDPRNFFPWESAYDRRFPQPLMDRRVQL